MATEISLYGPIGVSFLEEGNDAKTVVDKIKAAGMNPIDLHIHSSGGSVFDGYTIYNALLNHSPGVEVHIDGIAASIAAYIAMAGKTITMPQNGMMMLHNPTLEPGRVDRTKLQRQAQLLDKVTQSYAEAFVKRGVVTDEQVTAMMDAETWLTAPEAMLAGFIDDITPELALAANFDLSNFRRTPADLLAQAGMKPSKKKSGHDSPPKGYPPSRDQYADPENYKYPLDNAERTRAAWSYINKADDRSEYSASELVYIENRIKSAAKKFNVKISEEKNKESEGHFDIAGTIMETPPLSDAGTDITLPSAEKPPKPEQPAPPPPTLKDPSVLEKLTALLKPKTDLQAEINGLKSQIEVRDTAITDLNKQITALQAELFLAQKQAGELPAIRALIETLETEKKTVEVAAVDKVAALGFPARELPKGESDKDEKKDEPEATADSLLEELNKIDDPREFTRAYKKLQPKIKAAWQAEKAKQTRA